MFFYKARLRDLQFCWITGDSTVGTGAAESFRLGASVRAKAEIWHRLLEEVQRPLLKGEYVLQQVVGRRPRVRLKEKIHELIVLWGSGSKNFFYFIMFTLIY